MQTILCAHRCAVLHHGVVELVALSCTPREEAALAHVVVEMLQAAIPTMRRVEERKRNQTFPRMIILIPQPQRIQKTN